MSRSSVVSKSVQTHIIDNQKRKCKGSTIWFREQRYPPLQRFISDSSEYGKPLSIERRSSLDLLPSQYTTTATVGTQTGSSWRRPPKPVTVPTTSMSNDDVYYKPEVVQIESEDLVNDIKVRLLTNVVEFDKISSIRDETFWKQRCAKDFGIHHILVDEPDMTWLLMYRRAMNYVRNTNSYFPLELHVDSTIALSKLAYIVGEQCMCYIIMLAPYITNRTVQGVLNFIFSMSDISLLEDGNETSDAKLIRYIWYGELDLNMPTTISKQLMKDLFIPHLTKLNSALNRVLIPNYKNLSKSGRFTVLQTTPEYQSLHKFLNRFVIQICRAASAELTSEGFSMFIQDNILQGLATRRMFLNWFALTFPSKLIVSQKNERFQHFNTTQRNKLASLKRYHANERQRYESVILPHMVKLRRYLRLALTDEESQSLKTQLQQCRALLNNQSLKHQHRLDNYLLRRPQVSQRMWKMYDEITKVELKKILNKAGRTKNALYKNYLTSIIPSVESVCRFIISTVHNDQKYIDVLKVNDPNNDLQFIMLPANVLKVVLPRCIPSRLRRLLVGYTNYRILSANNTDYDMLESDGGSESEDDRQWEQA